MREENLVEIINLAMDDLLSNLHTITIAKITGVSDTTISCTPVTNRVVDGVSIKLPEFTKVPVFNFKGGESSISMPVSVGDYCMLLFVERCFDSWYQGQDFVAPPSLRMHDYSDGFALVGVDPLASAISIPNVMTFDGDADQHGDYTHIGSTDQDGDLTVTGDVDITGDYDQTGDLTLIGNMTITGNVIINGALTVNGVISGQGFSGIDGAPMETSGDINVTGGDVTADGIGLKTHRHVGVQTGTGTSGGPVA